MDEAYDCKSFLAGFFAGRGIRGHGDPDMNGVSITLSGAGDEWQYDNRAFKAGLSAGFLLHIPGEGKGES